MSLAWPLSLAQFLALPRSPHQTPPRPHRQDQCRILVELWVTYLSDDEILWV